MDFPLAQRLQQIEPFHVMEVLKRAAELEKAGRSTISMCIGEPDFPPAQPVLDAAAAALSSGAAMRYTAALGLQPLREAISEHYRTAFGVDVPAERIVITAGASAALLLACAALVERDAEVLMPDPSYPCNRHFISAFNGQPTLIPSGSAERFQLSAAMVESHWNANTRGVLLASPSNPTGTSIARDELERTLAVVRRHRGFALVDEIYQGLSYDAPPFTALELGDDIVVINSFSKYFCMTGWRLGWLVVPPAMLPAIEKLAQNFFICASSLAQHAALACFTPEAMAAAEERRAEFRRRRDYLVPELLALGFGIPVLPDGAFYVYADCSELSDDADRLTRDILDQTGVVLTPGLDFGAAGAQSFIRVSYATSMANLEEAVRRLRVYFGRPAAGRAEPT
ncbi:MAG: pyridoxal phosphate-dependent aminotransferase [Burkholderiaceae bacterium]|nr:pyridoxal phosphate-dependent aminotransferase [Burkholderiaceae bacterium]